MPSDVEVEILARPSLNFALEQAGVPVVNGVRVRNRRSVRIEGARVVLQLAPELGEPLEAPLPVIHPGEEATLGVLDVLASPGRLRTVIEAERARLQWKVVEGDEVLASGERPIDVLAWNEWPGDRGPRGLLAVFVTPNHGVIASILRRVRDRLMADTRNPAISAYQARSVERARVEVKAVYETVQALGLSYAGLPASFEQHGQKVRLPDQLMHDQIGNCVDITLLFASLLEQMGYRPLLVLIDGHAFPGVWLTEDAFPEEVVTDAARLRTGADLGNLVFFDSSMAIATPKVPFSDAVRVARTSLDVDDEFNWAIDVRVARLDKLRPLSVRDGTPAPEDPQTPAHEVLREADAIVAPPEPPPARRPAEPLEARLARWKERLLDLSLRNRLLSFRPTVRTAIPLYVHNLARFVERLATEQPLHLVPTPSRQPGDERDRALVAGRTDAQALGEVRDQDLGRGFVHTPFEVDELLVRGVALERAARSDLEEGGANTLFVGVGFLRWYESDHTDADRLAPLLLVPVALDLQRSGRAVRLRRRPEDVLPNYTLIERMRRDYGVELSAIADLALDDNGPQVERLLQAARAAILKMPRWEVRPGAAVGQFSFAKFLLWKDLDDNADVLLSHPVVQHIASGRALPFPNPTERVRPEDLDRSVPLAELPTVVDADSTQMAAVYSAMRGRSFVLQGPPGTGKSQTITNLIAAALAAGKTVLFVAEKMAALDVVYRRLQQAGLGDFCLELHSHKANKREVVQSLASALQRTTRLPPVPWRQRSEELGGMVADLNAAVTAMHTPRVLCTFYEGMGRLNAARGAPPVRMVFPAVLAAREIDVRTQLEEVRRFASAAAAVEPVAENPWRDARVARWSAEGEVRLGSALDRAREAGARALGAATALGRALGIILDDARAVQDAVALTEAVAAGPTAELAMVGPEWAQLVERARAWGEQDDAQRARRTSLGKRWKDEVFDEDLDRLGASFRRWAGALLAVLVLWSPRRRLSRVSRGRLPRNGQIATDLQVAREVAAAQVSLTREARAIAERLGGAWDGAAADGLRAAIDRTQRLRKVVDRLRAEGAPVPERALALADPTTPEERRREARDLAQQAEEARTGWAAARDAMAAELGWTPPSSFAAFAAEVDAYRAAMPRFRQWALYGEAAAGLGGLSPLADAHRSGAVVADALVAAFERAFYQQWVDAVRDSEPALRTFSGAARHDLVERFRQHDRAHTSLATRTIVERLEQNIPPASMVSESSEVGVVLREAKKTLRHMPVRRLLQEIPNLLPKLKPCLLMSPLSVVQYLPADGRRFDLVVFDEASQIGTHDAIGALARGEQVVIVGDSRQLPPTSFFQRGADVPIDENDFDELESILDEAVASGLPEEHLGWHYRSRHEALIQFSNVHYYGNRLNVFPAARGAVEDLGLSWHFVPTGVYERVVSRTNPVEARALVDFLVDELKRVVPGAVTYGIVTFSQTQQMLVADYLDVARQRHPEIEGHFAAIDEPVFVKNLENVQGDERDVILFSIGYGPDEKGRVSMNFGALNRPGGERRLNVAVTRARRKLRVFSTMSHTQIDLARTKAVGARHLKEFLRYAEQYGAQARDIVAAEDFETSFERDVHDALVAEGFEVATQVGCGAYRIDLAVLHPERPGEYLLGVELDGPAYGAAASARDRDRLREQVLEGLGWRLHRIWSNDWWYDRDRETARLVRAVKEALVSNAPTPVDIGESDDPTEGEVEPVEPGGAEPYRITELERISFEAEHIHQAPYQGALLKAVEKVVQTEAPVHVDVIVRRVGGAFNGAKLSDRTRKRVMAVLGALRPTPVLWDRFVWPPNVDPRDWTRFRGPSPDGWVREPEELPLEEVVAATAAVLRANLSMPAVDLARETARVMLGSARLGRKIALVMDAAIVVLLERGEASREGDRILHSSQ